MSSENYPTRNDENLKKFFIIVDKLRQIINSSSFTDQQKMHQAATNYIFYLVCLVLELTRIKNVSPEIKFRRSLNNLYTSTKYIGIQRWSDITWNLDKNNNNILFNELPDDAIDIIKRLLRIRKYSVETDYEHKVTYIGESDLEIKLINYVLSRFTVEA